MILDFENGFLPTYLPQRAALKVYLKLNVQYLFSGVNSANQTKLLPSTFAPGLNLNANLFVATSDGKHIVSGGHWDNSLRIFSIHKCRYVASVVRHIDVVTCVAASGHFVISGSLDTTSIIWDISTSLGSLRPVQV